MAIMIISHLAIGSYYSRSTLIKVEDASAWLRIGIGGWVWLLRYLHIFHFILGHNCHNHNIKRQSITMDYLSYKVKMRSGAAKGLLLCYNSLEKTCIWFVTQNKKLCTIIMIVQFEEFNIHYKVGVHLPYLSNIVPLSVCQIVSFFWLSPYILNKQDSILQKANQIANIFTKSQSKCQFILMQNYWNLHCWSPHFPPPHSMPLLQHHQYL
jgi:hypothetical protein